MTSFEWLLIAHNACCRFFSVEKPDRLASKSELRRWLLNKAVIMNNIVPQPDDELGNQLFELILFPKSEKRRTTIL